MREVGELYAQARRKRFPALGKRVGDFAFYDSLLAGCADRAANGEALDPNEVPIPDDETVRHVEFLREKAGLTNEETEFLEYFDLLEEIRSAIGRR
jgi:hypothetical protein